MTTTASIAVLLTINLGIIWLMMAAPVGRRTITFHRHFPVCPERLWRAVHPGGHEADWNPAVISAKHMEIDGTGQVEVAYRHSDRHGEPVRRIFAFREREDSSQRHYEATSRVVDDSTLDVSFWHNFEEYRAVTGSNEGAMLTFAQTDNYRGLAFYLFRYLMIRRELSALAAWLRGEKPRAGGVLEHPSTQALFAMFSTLMLWPFFGLNAGGLTISITLTVVIILHELGHMAAYRAFGHKRVRMIFVPLLGGIAIGSRPYNSRFEIATCALMGAGMSAFLVPLTTLVHELAASGILPRAAAAPALVFLLILGAFNILNLLPMSRFDGGQVLRQIFPGRRMLVVGSFGVTLAMLWVGYRIGLLTQALMAALAVFTLMSLMGSNSVKLRGTFAPMHPGERLMAGLGLYAAVAIHAHGIVYACDRLFG